MELFSISLRHEKKGTKAQIETGLLPISIRITRKRTKDIARDEKQIKTGEYCTAEVFKALFPKIGDSYSKGEKTILKRLAADKNNIEIKKRVEAIKEKYYSVIVNDKENKILNTKQLHRIVTSGESLVDIVPIEENDSLNFWLGKYFEKRSALEESTKKAYTSSINSFYRFVFGNNYEVEKCHLSIFDIDKVFMSKWEKWCRNPKKHKNNKENRWTTIGDYAGDLKTILLFAAKSKYSNYELSRLPIGDDVDEQYQIPIENTDGNIIRYLEEEELQKFKDYEPKNEQEELAKDVWFLSYYLGGCNAKDLVNFRKSNIQKENDQLVFYRQKNRGKRSKKASRVPLTKEAKRLIEKYKLKSFTILKRFKSAKEQMQSVYGNELIPNITGLTNHIPIEKNNVFLLNFHQNSKSGKQHLTHTNLTSRINGKEDRQNYLIAISKDLGISPPIKFEMARHSCFSNLLRQGMNFAQIMEISGHSKLSTLQGYLAKLNPKNQLEIYERI